MKVRLRVGRGVIVHSVHFVCQVSFQLELDLVLGGRVLVLKFGCGNVIQALFSRPVWVRNGIGPRQRLWLRVPQLCPLGKGTQGKGVSGAQGDKGFAVSEGRI